MESRDHRAQLAGLEQPAFELDLFRPAVESFFRNGSRVGLFIFSGTLAVVPVAAAVAVGPAAGSLRQPQV